VNNDSARAHGFTWVVADEDRRLAHPGRRPITVNGDTGEARVLEELRNSATDDGQLNTNTATIGKNGTDRVSEMLSVG
jgi:hypothetical protein